MKKLIYVLSKDYNKTLNLLCVDWLWNYYLIWLSLALKVYDVTPYMDEHPGGDDVLLAVTGTFFYYSMIAIMFNDLSLIQVSVLLLKAKMQRMNSKTRGTAKQLGNSWKSISLASLTKLLYLRYQSLRSTRRRSQKTLFRSLSIWQSSTGLFLFPLSPSLLRWVSCSLATSSSLSGRWSWAIELLGESTIHENPPYRFWITGKNNIISQFSSLNECFYILSWDHVLMKWNLMIWLMDALVLLLLIKSMPCT